MVSAPFSRTIKWPSTYFKKFYKVSHRVKNEMKNIAPKFGSPWNLDVPPMISSVIEISIQTCIVFVFMLFATIAVVIIHLENNLLVFILSFLGK